MNVRLPTLIVPLVLSLLALPPAAAGQQPPVSRPEVPAAATLGDQPEAELKALKQKVDKARLYLEFLKFTTQMGLAAQSQSTATPPDQALQFFRLVGQLNDQKMMELFMRGAQAGPSEQAQMGMELITYVLDAAIGELK